jgi:MoaA/NifB/PqqE/SkfB family radical SAM enzyme
MSLLVEPKAKRRKSVSRILRKVSRFVSSIAPGGVVARPKREKKKRKMRVEALPLVEQLRHVSELKAETITRQLTREEIEREYAGDPFFKNYCLNLWEYTHGVDVLTTYPWNVALPLADLCNARCTFCTSWLAGRNVLTLEQFKRYEEVLRYAHIIGLQGHGEPLVNPHIDAILDRLSAILDTRASCYIITNGVFLEKRLDALLKARVKTFNFSLNATTAKTHDIVMGLGPSAFDMVMSGIRQLIEIRDASTREIEVTISFVLTADNMHEAADFVRLANSLRVTRFYLRTLAPLNGTTQPGLNYHLLPPYRHPDFDRLYAETVEALRHSQVKFEAFPETWRANVLSERLSPEQEQSLPVIGRSGAMNDPAVRAHYRDPKDMHGRGAFLSTSASDDANPFGRVPPFNCKFIYQQLISTYLNFRIVPCCYITDVPGHEPIIFDGERPFFDYWNSDAMVYLRRTLRDGPMLTDCKRCPMQG